MQHGVNAKIEERIIDAMTKQDPKDPIVHELGGGFYYSCHWLTCGATISRWMNYCPECGQRIDWSVERIYGR